MTARSKTLIMAASLALVPALALAQDRAVPRGGGGGGGGSSGGGSHPSPGVSSSGSSGGSSSGSGYSGGSSSGSGHSPSVAERRHPRAGTGRGSGGSGYYPGYPGYYPPYYPGYPGYGGGGGYYWGSWWPYGSYGWYGYPGWGFGWGGWGGGGTVTHYVERESGSVRVLVDPSEARVYVDGYYAGTVDDFDGLFQRLNLSPGRHEIAVKLEGYKTHRVRVYVAPDSTVKLHYDLERGQGETFEDLAKDVPESEARREREQEERWSESEERSQQEQMAAVGGTLRLTVRPADASIYVDGAFRGSGREASSLKLVAGKHRIEVVRPGYRTMEREVDIAPGETSEITIELERPSV